MKMVTSIKLTCITRYLQRGRTFNDFERSRKSRPFASKVAASQIPGIAEP